VVTPDTSSSASGSDLVVGVDIGATKTHIALGKDDAVVAEEVVATSAWRTVSSVHNAADLVGLIRRLLGDTATDGLPVGVGAHGCDSTQQCLDLEEALSVHLVGPVQVLNDAELMPLAMGFSDAIGVVSGTGSIGVARDSDHHLVVAGGWGWILGDEGGASGIVREAVRAVLLAIDDGQPQDRLADRLMACFKATNGPELAMGFTRSSSAAYWGSHAEEVFFAAEEGSEIAAEVIEGAARELAVLVERLVDRGVKTEHVVAGGGVIRRQRRLRDSFIATLGRTHPEITATVLDRAPVIGAIRLASSLGR
jgi:N-acetylglucosamine kinase-like BadF-type ATPase